MSYYKFRSLIFSEYSSEKETLTKDLESVTASLASTKEELRKAKEEIQALNGRLQERGGEIQQAVSDLTQKVEKLEEDNKALANKYEDEKKKHEALKGEHQELLDAYESLKNSKITLQQQTQKRIAELEAENRDKLQVEIERLSEGKAQIERELHEKEKQMEANIINLESRLQNASKEKEDATKRLEVALKGWEKEKATTQNLFKLVQERDAMNKQMDRTITLTLDGWEKELTSFIGKLDSNQLLQSKPANSLPSRDKDKIEKSTADLKNYLNQVVLKSQDALMNEMIIPCVAQMLTTLQWEQTANKLNAKNCQQALNDILAFISHSVEIIPATKSPTVQGRILLAQLKNNPFLYTVCFNHKDGESNPPLYIFIGDSSLVEGQFLTGVVTKVVEDTGEVRGHLGKHVPTDKKIFRVFLGQVERLSINLSLKAERKNLHVKANDGYRGTMNQPALRIEPSRPMPVTQEQPSQQQNQRPSRKDKIKFLNM